ncbi:MAG: prefoldin subunit alpha [Candidatus Nezhaarchaeota archaeon]|nr:prefoldin subunit alpha [Candidatus Nezhaarchaeota archaeon]
MKLAEGGKPKERREDAGKLVAEWQYLQSLAEALKQRIDLATAAITEMENTVQAIDELGKLSQETETLFLLGANAYAKGKITETRRILVNIGADLLVEKSLEDARKFFESRIEGLKKVVVETQQQLASVTGRLSKLEPELRKVAESQGGG